MESCLIYSWSFCLNFFGVCLGFLLEFVLGFYWTFYCGSERTLHNSSVRFFSTESFFALILLNLVVLWLFFKNQRFWVRFFALNGFFNQNSFSFPLLIAALIALLLDFPPISFVRSHFLCLILFNSAIFAWFLKKLGLLRPILLHFFAI